MLVAIVFVVKDRVMQQLHLLVAIVTLYLVAAPLDVLEVKSR